VKSVRVPTEAMWNGDLSNAQDTAGSPVTIYDSLTADANRNRQPFTGNIIPPDRISATAKTLSALTARPTDNVNPYRALNFVHFYPHRTKLWNLTIKGDQHFGDKDSLSVRYTRSTRNHTTEGGVVADPATPADGAGTSRTESLFHSLRGSKCNGCLQHLAPHAMVCFRQFTFGTSTSVARVRRANKSFVYAIRFILTIQEVP
jgi:hypothetical protein